MRLAGAVLLVLFGVTLPVFGQVTVTNNSPLPLSSVGANHSVQFTATPTGQPYQWSITAGSLPQGLNLSPQGVISGTPKTGGTSTFTVTATNPQTLQSGSKQLSIGILQISSPSPLPGATLGASYSVILTVSDGPQVTDYSWFTDVPPPPGLTLANNGILSGTPTSTGTFNFPVFV